MQDYYLNRAHDLKCALMELCTQATVTGVKILDTGVTIQIEATEKYQDGQFRHNCKLIFKGE